MAIFDELRQRRLIQTAALYIAIAWGGTEILAFLIEALWGEAPATTASRYLAILFIAGFPVAMYLAWTRDLGSRARRLFSAATLAVLLVGLLLWIAPSGPEIAPVRTDTDHELLSIAVLPLENLSGEPGQDYFALGMTEALIAELSRLGDLRVISRTSVMRYANTQKSVPEIARELGVDAIVEGSVVRDDTQVRITAQLIEAATDYHLWADSFEGELTNVLNLQREAAHAMAAGIGSRTSGETGRKRIRKKVDPEAYDAYLKAQIMQLDAGNDLRATIDAAEHVIELDPDFAPGYAFASDLYGYLSLVGEISHAEGYVKAQQFARQALELDAELPYAHIAMGRVYYQYEWDWEAARKEFERGLELDPNDALGLALYGSFRVLIDHDCTRGLELMEAARNRDPFNPAMHLDLGVYNLHCRNFERSVADLERLLELAPDYHLPRLMIAWNRSLLGQHDRAVATCTALLEERQDRFDQFLISGCATVFAWAGQREEAQRETGRLLDPPSGQVVDPALISFACAAMGDADCAVDRLQQALRQRSSNMIFLRTAPVFDPIRSDPRFIAIMEQMKFPP